MLENNECPDILLSIKRIDGDNLPPITIIKNRYSVVKTTHEIKVKERKRKIDKIISNEW